MGRIDRLVVQDQVVGSLNQCVNVRWYLWHMDLTMATHWMQTWKDSKVEVRVLSTQWDLKLEMKFLNL